MCTTIKIIKYGGLRNQDKKRIKELMDVFVRRQGLRRVTNRDIKRAMERDEHTLFAALNEDGDIIGVTALIEMNIFTAKVGHIEEVVVYEGYQNQGVATQILREVIKVAKKRKMNYLKLNTNVKNISNYLYQKLGFVRKDDNLYKFYL